MNEKQMQRLLEMHGFIFDGRTVRFPLEERIVEAHNAWVEYRDEMNKLFEELGRVIYIAWSDE